jgi:hypothetical protein
MKTKIKQYKEATYKDYTPKEKQQAKRVTHIKSVYARISAK